MTASEPRGVEHPLMTLRQAAEKTGLSATTLRRYIKAGRLRARLIPGRYGPEYVVDDDDLHAAGLDGRGGSDNEESTALARNPGNGETSVRMVPAQDMVPGLLYRELMMKHEHLLVQYGMLRVSGRQLYEVRQAAEQKAEQARQAAAELRRTRDRHARETGGLKTELRRAELELAEREERIRELERRVAQLEMQLRNQLTAHQMDEHFSRRLKDAPSTEH